MPSWCVYILRCSDGSLYTGSCNNLTRRVAQHTSGRGSRYTRSRLPVELVYHEEAGGRSEAQRREYAIKQLSRTEKLNLIKGVGRA